MPRKRILYFEPTPSGTGSIHSLKAIINLLDKNRFKPCVWYGRKVDGGEISGVQIFKSQTSMFANSDFFPAGWRPIYLKHIVASFMRGCADILCVPLVLKRIHPDLVHVNCGVSPSVAIVAKLMGYPVVWHIREAVYLNWIGRLQDRIYAWAADQVIAISELVASRIPYAVKAGKVRVLYNATGHIRQPSRQEVAEFNSLHRINPNALKLLLLGTPSKNKGYGYLAKVAARTKGKSIQYILAGRMPAEPKGKLGEIVNSWHVLESCGEAVFTGHVDAATAIAAADIVVCPNLTTEPLGRTVLEAYRLGRPVMAMNKPAFTETIVDGHSGWLLPEEVEIWAEKIIELQQNRSLIGLCAEGVQEQNCFFDDQKYISEIETIYDQVSLTSRTEP
ncbi:MAG: glycosyltransferase [Spirochaetales bacterium]|jgi:glycosyltransferase involved in cell wall biosynthesis|nr:glycosyltransferase [Spirochaetales bacterium]